MAYDRIAGAAHLSPEQIAETIIKPLERESVAFEISRIQTHESATLRIPVLDTDGDMGWIPEGQDLPLSQPTTHSVNVTPPKLATVVPVTREAFDDSEAGLLGQLTDSLLRRYAVKVDAGFFGNAADPAPAGLTALAAGSGSAVVKQSVAADFGGNTDWAVDAAAAIEDAGGTMTAIVANSADMALLAKLKTGTGSAQPLLAPNGDATSQARRVINGVPVYVSAAVPARTLWALDGSRAVVAVRRKAEIETDKSVYFDKYSIAVRFVARIGWAFPHPETIVKITRAA